MQLFLSHANPSKPLVRRIAQGLPPHVTWWLDQDEMGAGHELASSIGEAITERCDYVVVFLDEPALASEWVRRELNLALRREADLRRPFVLPVLLADVRVRLGEWPELEGRLYQAAWTRDDAGLEQASRALAEQLFELSSRLIEQLRDVGARGMVDALSRESTAYLQAAYQWRASLGFGVRVLCTEQDAFDHVRASVQRYNEVADAFIPRLTVHRDRLTDAWSRYRGLCEDVRDLVLRIEAVYRGEMFRLNEIHALVQQANADPAARLPAPLAEADRHRQSVLDAAGTALDALTAQLARVVAGLEREIA
jgi:hypothetical protein